MNYIINDSKLFYLKLCLFIIILYYSLDSVLCEGLNTDIIESDAEELERVNKFFSKYGDNQKNFFENHGREPNFYERNPFPYLWGLFIFSVACESYGAYKVYYHHLYYNPDLTVMAFLRWLFFWGF